MRLCTTFANSLLAKEEKPNHWSIRNIIPVSKKGSLNKQNYRTINLISLKITIQGPSSVIGTKYATISAISYSLLFKLSFHMFNQFVPFWVDNVLYDNLLYLINSIYKSLSDSLNRKMQIFYTEIINVSFFLLI